MANVSVIGAGSWGLALARRLCKNGHDVTVWSPIGKKESGNCGNSMRTVQSFRE